ASSAIVAAARTERTPWRADRGHGVCRATAAAAPSPLRLRAQSPLPYRERVADAAAVTPARGRAKSAVAIPVGFAPVPRHSTSPGTGEVASLGEPERALSIIILPPPPPSRPGGTRRS